MQYYAAGPVNMEFTGGILDNWHLETFNNSGVEETITFTVFDVDHVTATIIGQTSGVVLPKSHLYLTLSTLKKHHTMVQVDYTSGVRDIFLTLYGRDKNDLAIPGAIFYNKDFISLENRIE